MTRAEQWRALQGLVDGALDRPRDARAAYLDEACAADAALRVRAAQLLDACERVDDEDGRLATPAVAPLLGRAAAQGALRDAVHDALDEAVDEAARTVALQADVAEALRSALAGRYAVERELGRGGTATVYLARDLRHGRPVALKVLAPALGAALSAERFLREIRVTAALQHPHILPLFDSGEAAGRLYYVMPYVDGETLRERLARTGALPEADAVRLLGEVADALAYAHERGVVHRDVKPANILLHGGATRGHALVADFGIARAVDRARAAQDPSAVLLADGGTDTLTGAGTSPGTPAYMAPEEARADAGVDHRADLYAFGVVAYEALAGAHPFGARGSRALIAAHRDETPAPLAARRPEMPAALATLVTRLLAKDPAERPQSAGEVVAALGAVRPAAEFARPALDPASDAASDSEGAAESARRVPVRDPPSGRAAGFAAAAVALLAVGGAIVIGARADRQNASPPRAAAVGARAAGATRLTAIRALAVVPFVNTGGDPQDDYFSDGLTDELAHALARLPGLRLAGRTSSYTFKGRSVAAQAVGRALGVDALVDGTVRWDSVYETHSRDVFAVQDALTRSIAAALAPALGDRAARGTEDAAADVARGTTDQDAYEWYLEGRYNFLLRNPTRLARAHAGLSMAYSLWPVY
ncbi:MAG TPA: serine/threonine-protein kinase, partial [Gemmatirosa sp.]